MDMMGTVGTVGIIGGVGSMRFTLSVDDGHPLDLRLADKLARHGIPATFYVPTTNCEGPPVMSAPQLRTLAAQFELGSHTAEHRFLAQLGRAAAWRQVRDGKASLEDALGRRVDGFCYPGGRYRREHVALVRAAGFTHARTTQNLRTDAGRQAFEMPTTLQFYPHPRRVLVRNFVSQRQWRLRRPHWLQRWPSATGWAGCTRCSRTLAGRVRCSTCGCTRPMSKRCVCGRRWTTSSPVSRAGCRPRSG